MNYTLNIDGDKAELWGFGIRLTDDEARRVIRHAAGFYGADSTDALKEIARILGGHDGDAMSSAPHRAAAVARAELERLGVHEQETHARRPTVVGRG